MSAITFTSLGGAEEIGANSHLVSSDGFQVLLDCGLHPKKEGNEALPALSLLNRAPDAVIVSHGHVDHCGAVPYLLNCFPSTTPYATGPTLKIMDRMLHNSVAVMETISQERGIREYPLYTHQDVEYAVRRTYGLGMDQEFAVALDCPLRVAFHHAGHVLGSASIRVEMPGHTLFYTGDICSADQELLAGLTPLDRSVEVDTLVIECTYGASEFADDLTYEDETDRFVEAAKDVLEGGGCALVPSFALGRTQEMLNLIARLQDEGRLPDVPVYTSGLGKAIYEVYDRFQDYLRQDAVLTPLSQFKRIGDVWNRRALRDLLKRPVIIVATSGMMIENTPSALIAQEMVRHGRHGIFFVGYLDPDTLGYRLLHAEKGEAFVFELGGPAVTVRLDNIQSFYFSAHAPRKALKSMVERLKPKNVVFVHGDPDAVRWMAANAGNGSRRHVPVLGQTLTLEG